MNDLSIPSTPPSSLGGLQHVASLGDQLGIAPEQPPVTPRRAILSEATELIDGDRARLYGDASAAYDRIGIIWGALLGLPEAIPGHTALLMMSQVKAVRSVDNPGHRDSWVDNAGYVGLAGEAAAR